MADSLRAGRCVRSLHRIIASIGYLFLALLIVLAAFASAFFVMFRGNADTGGWMAQLYGSWRAPVLTYGMMIGQACDRAIGNDEFDSGPGLAAIWRFAG